jgi:hypothetical protein
VLFECSPEHRLTNRSHEQVKIQRPSNRELALIYDGMGQCAPLRVWHCLANARVVVDDLVESANIYPDHLTVTITPLTSNWLLRAVFAPPVGPECCGFVTAMTSPVRRINAPEPRVARLGAARP